MRLASGVMGSSGAAVSRVAGGAAAGHGLPVTAEGIRPALYFG